MPAKKKVVSPVVSTAWTHDYPTQAGYYWTRLDATKDPHVIQVIGGKVKMANEQGYPVPMPFPQSPYKGNEFQGPIAPAGEARKKNA